MAINPYQAAAGQTKFYESLAKSKSLAEKMRGGAAIHKGKLKTEFEEELMQAEKRAQEALQEEYKQSKGGGLLSSLLGFIPGVGPILSGVAGGVTSALGAKKAGKHAEKMASRAKDYAMDIDPKWGKSFLGSAARKHEEEAGSFYGDILKSAQDVAKETSSLGGMLKTGMASGLSSYAMGKAMQGVGESMKAAKAVKGATTTLPANIGGKAGILPVGPEGFAGMPNPTFNIAELAKQTNVSEDLISKLLEAKTPGIRGIYEGIKGAGGKFGKTDPLEGQADWLKGLIAMLASGKVG